MCEHTTYLMTRRFVGAVGCVGAVPAAWLTPMKTPPTLITADREMIPLFAWIVKLAVPEPVPDPVTVAQAAFDDVVHAQVLCVVTVIVPEAPVGAAVMRVGETVNVHVPLGSLTVNVRPAIVSVTDRAIVPVFAAAVYPTVPEPMPLAPLVIVTHVPPPDAVQLQFDDVVTDTVPLPPEAGNDWLVGEIVNEHAAAACVTV